MFFDQLDAIGLVLIDSLSGSGFHVISEPAQALLEME